MQLCYVSNKCIYIINPSYIHICTISYLFWLPFMLDKDKILFLILNIYLSKASVIYSSLWWEGLILTNLTHSKTYCIIITLILPGYICCIKRFGSTLHRVVQTGQYNWMQVRLDTDEKVGYSREDCNTDAKLICLHMRRYICKGWYRWSRLDTDENIGYRWEGWIQMRRFKTNEKVGYRWEGWIQTRRLDTDEKVAYRWEVRRLDTN